MSAVRRLFCLDYGTFRVREDGRLIGIQGYLVDAGDRLVLVDTGFPPAYADDPAGAGRADDLDAFGEVVEVSLPDAQLALAGYRPGDVTDLVLTHGDIDHVGSAAAFARARLVVGRAELEAGPPRYFGERRPLAWPAAAETVLVDGDVELVPGLTLLSTPGHSPGHLSLLVRLPRAGAVVLAVDAISRPAEVEEGYYRDAWDHARAAESAARLLELAARERALLVYGHDPVQWPALPKAPAHFD